MPAHSVLRITDGRSKVWALCLMMLVGGATAVRAQNFSSGSNQSDGAFDLTGKPSGTVVNFVPSSFPGDQHALNIFNFTQITIPAGVTVSISGNTVTAPVIWLASGDVDIEGTIDISGAIGYSASPILDGRRRSIPGPGGFSGGVGGKFDPSASTPQPVAQPGDGPGGGAGGGTVATPWCNTTLNLYQGVGGTFTGNSFLVPLVGGSGGGGGNLATASGGLTSSPYAAGGGAGGGAILVASSTSITVNGTINANGGNGGTTGMQCCSVCGTAPYIGVGGGGSGGGIRLAAPTIVGTGTLTAVGGNEDYYFAGYSDQYGMSGANGVVRVEAFTDSFTGTISGSSSMGSPFATFVPTTPIPSITVVSVGTATLPQPPTGSLTTPDATLDTTTLSTITIQAANIPVGTVITLHVFSDNSTDQTVQSTPLAGTLQSSTATATVTFPSGYSLNYVKATWSQ